MHLGRSIFIGRLDPAAIIYIYTGFVYYFEVLCRNAPLRESFVVFVICEVFADASPRVCCLRPPEKDVVAKVAPTVLGAPRPIAPREACVALCNGTLQAFYRV